VSFSNTLPNQLEPTGRLDTNHENTKETKEKKETKETKTNHENTKGRKHEIGSRTQDTYSPTLFGLSILRAFVLSCFRDDGFSA
jgi:hypothetical protein